jgi:HAD superfamily hydrolase (TIGR01509 family)
VHARRAAEGPVDVAAVVLDLDGVLLDSERVWAEAKQAVTEARGGRWHDGAQPAMMGMSSPEWSRYLVDALGAAGPPDAVADDVVRRLSERYGSRLPLLPGAVACVRALAGRWPLALASSANRPLIDLVLEASELAPCFAASVSSEEVERGKPAPDVYLEAARRLGAAPPACVAVEDSDSGIRSARAAGMRVVAVPNPDYPPGEEALRLASRCVASIAEVTPALVAGLPPAA